MALIFSQGYMRGNGNPNLDNQIKDGGNAIPKLYVDDVTDSVYGFDNSFASGEKWYKYFAGIVSKTVDLKVWLRGPSLGATMRTDLATKELIPLNEPYEGLEFVRKGYSGETVASLQVFKDNNITDWILVELRDRDNPEIVRYNRAALLKNNGQIVDVDGVSILEFPFIKDFDYFVSVKHRNHLGLMTSEAVDIMQPIDFTLINSSLFGLLDNRIEHSGNYCMRAGTVGNGKLLIFSGDKGWESKFLTDLNFNKSAFIQNVYNVFDLNMDGNIRFAGGGNDRLVALLSLDNDLANTYIEFIPPFINNDIYNKNKLYIEYDSDNLPVKEINYTPLRVFEEKYFGKTSLVIPKGTTAERPTTPETSMVRYNTTDNKLEYYNGTSWIQL